MTAIDELLEEARQKLTGDSWYTSNPGYALQLFMPWTEDLKDNVVFLFPVGPEELRVRRVFRQSVTPTLGGVVAEERGVAWHEIHVAGTFGLRAKKGYDSTLKTEEGFFAAISGADRLSGPMWTQRMLKHVFDRYAALKADPSAAAETYLVWHNFKTEESFVVVPTEVDVDRNLGKRMMFPFAIRFKAIAPADTIEVPSQALGKLAAFIAGVKNVIATIAKGLAVVQAAFQEASALLGEVRYFIATVDALFDQIGRIVSSAEDFVQGVNDTIDAGKALVDSAAQALDDVLSALSSDTANDAGIVASAVVPESTVQVFRTLQDGIHTLGSQPAAFGRAYADETAALLEEGAGVHGVSDEELEAAEAGELEEDSVTRPGDKALKEAGALPQQREYRPYQGYVPYTILGGDTIQGIASKTLGDGAYYYDIALMNGLKPPYITWSGGPNIARPGDVIAIPTLTTQRATNAATANTDATAEATFGRDFRLRETGRSRPGRPEVDLRPDKRTMRDFATIGGVDNLVQATQMRMWTTRGTMPFYPGYGLPTVVGLKNSSANVSLLKIAMRSTLRQDSRIDRLVAMQATIGDDILDFELSVLPVGSTVETTINTALV